MTKLSPMEQTILEMIHEHGSLPIIAILDLLKKFALTAGVKWVGADTAKEWIGNLELLGYIKFIPEIQGYKITEEGKKYLENL